jgi:hypothetical protein
MPVCKAMTLIYFGQEKPVKAYCRLAFRISGLLKLTFPRRIGKYYETVSYYAFINVISSFLLAKVLMRSKSLN